jgi:hypothetical protein
MYNGLPLGTTTLVVIGNIRIRGRDTLVQRSINDRITRQVIISTAGQSIKGLGDIQVPIRR